MGRGSEWARAIRGFRKNHGGTTAFYGWQREFAFLEHANRATGGALRLWGLDQELMGSSKYLLESMLEQHPGARSTALIRQMLHEDEADYRNAARSGDPAAMFVLQVKPAQLSALTASLQSDGNARSSALARALVETGTSMSTAATNWQVARIAIGRCS